MLNNIILYGRLVKDPALRQTQSNTPVCAFTIACERDSKEKQTDFIDCVAWRHTGEFIAKNFVKGNAILVNGRLQLRDWTDKDGNKRRSAEVAVDRAWFCERKANPDERPPMPSDADAPPAVDMEQKQRDLAELERFDNVTFADASAPMPWEM